MVIGLGASLLAAMLFGVAAVWQAVAARNAGLVSWAMARVGAAYLLGWLLHLVAIAMLPLYLAQVGIAVSLVVTAVLASRVVGEPLHRRHWAAIGTVAVGLALLVASAGPVGSNLFTTDRTVALYAGLGVLLLLSALALRVPGARGGVLLAVLGGIAYGGSPVATRSLVDPALDAETIAPALTIGLFGVLGFLLYSVAMRRTSVTAATAPLVLLETLVPAVIGVVEFGDRVRSGWWPVAVVGFALSTVGTLALCDSEARLEQHRQPQPEPQPG